MKAKKRFKEIAALWLEAKRPYVKVSTHSAYVVLVTRHLVPAFGEMSGVTEAVVQDFVLRKLDAGLSRKFIKDMLVVLKMILHFGAKRGYAAPRQLAPVFPTEKAAAVTPVFGAADQRQILRHILAEPSNKGLGIYISLVGGLRIGEVCGLTWDDLDTEAGIIRVTKTVQRIYHPDGGRRYTELCVGPPKSPCSVREVPMTDDLLRLVRSLKKGTAGTDYVLSNGRRPVEPRTYRNYYKKTLEAIGAPYAKFHALRHSFATRCIDARCDYKTVSTILGHATIGTTLNLYVHPSLAQKRRCIEQMCKLIR